MHVSHLWACMSTSARLQLLQKTRKGLLYLSPISELFSTAAASGEDKERPSVSVSHLWALQHGWSFCRRQGEAFCTCLQSLSPSARLQLLQKTEAYIGMPSEHILLTKLIDWSQALSASFLCTMTDWWLHCKLTTGPYKSWLVVIFSKYAHIPRWSINLHISQTSWLTSPSPPAPRFFFFLVFLKYLLTAWDFYIFCISLLNFKKFIRWNYHLWTHVSN